MPINDFSVRHCQTASVAPLPDRIFFPKLNFSSQVELVSNCVEQAEWESGGRQLQHLMLEHDDNQIKLAGVQPLRQTLLNIFLAINWRFDSTPLLDSVSNHWNALSQGMNDVVKYTVPFVFSGADAASLPQEQTPQYDPVTADYAYSAVVDLLAQHDDTAIQNQAHPRLRNVIKSAINFSSQSETARAALASSIQQDQGNYGGSPGETLSRYAQEAIIRNWIEIKLFDSNIDDYLAKKIANDARFSDFTSIDIQSWLSEIAAASDSTFERKIWLDIVCGSVPIMRYLDAGGDQHWHHIERMKLHDFEWGQLHAGLLFFQSAHLDPKDVSLEQALAWGKMMLAQLEMGAAPEQWWNFFRLPAMLRYATEGHRQTEGDALLAYRTAYKKLLEDELPGIKFKQLMENYKTRAQLAQEIIERDCPGMNVATYLNWSDFLKSAWFCNSYPPTQEVENVSKQYQRQIDDIADAYRPLDNLLLIVAYEKLPENERDFIRSAEVKRLQAEFSAADKLNYGLAGTNHLARQGLTVALRKQVELFSARAQCGNLDEERIYVLEKQAPGYCLKRIDRNRSAYHDLALDPGRIANDNNFQLKINPLGNNALKQASQDLRELFSQIAQKHQASLAQQLHSYGNDQTGLEKTGDIMLSMVPFYLCLSATDEGEAAQSCSIDILALLPGIGEIGTLPARFGQVFIRGSMEAMQSTASELSARSTLAEVLREGGRNVAEHLILPVSQTISQVELNPLLVTAVRMLDPGFELLYDISSVSLEQAIRLGEYMEKYIPFLSDTFPKLSTSPKHMPLAEVHHTYFYGRFPGIDRDIEVIRLEPALSQGNVDMYTRINPETKEATGRKYTLSADGILDPIAPQIPTRQHLGQNVLVQGLGGTGALRQAAIWGNAAPVSINFLQELMRATPQQIASLGGLANIALRRQVRLEELTRYLTEDLSLTEEGSAFLARQLEWSADAASSLKPITDTELIRWHQLTQDQSVRYDPESYAVARNLNPFIWNTLVKKNGEFYPSGKRRLELAQARASAAPAAVVPLPADAGPSAAGSAQAHTMSGPGKNRLSHASQDANIKRARIASAGDAADTGSADPGTSGLQRSLEHPLPAQKKSGSPSMDMPPETIITVASLKISDWGACYARFKTFPPSRKFLIMQKIIDDVNACLAAKDNDAARIAAMISIKAKPEGGYSFYAGNDIAQFTVLGPSETLSMHDRSLHALVENAKDKNVGVIQVRDDLKFYVALKDIPKNEQLLIHELDLGNTPAQAGEHENFRSRRMVLRGF